MRGWMTAAVVGILGCSDAVEKSGWEFEDPRIVQGADTTEPSEAGDEPGRQPQPDPVDVPDRVEPQPDPAQQPNPNLDPDDAASIAQACGNATTIVAGDEWWRYDLRDAVPQYERVCPLELVDDVVFFRLDFENYPRLRINVRPADPEIFVSPSVQLVDDGIARYYPMCESPESLTPEACLFFEDGVGRGNALSVLVERPEILDTRELEPATVVLAISHYGVWEETCANRDCTMIVDVVPEF